MTPAATAVQGTLFEVDEVIAGVPAVDVGDYDVIVVNTSAGKDSVAIAVRVAGLARTAGVLDRVIAIHADLGVMEWAGTRDLAEQQARAAGISRFEVVTYTRHGEVDDLLGYALRHGKFPGPGTQWCTASLKRDPTEQAVRRITDAYHAAHPDLGRAVRVLMCYGMRAEESGRRARQLPVQPYPGLTTRTRTTTRWLPVHRLTTGEVFALGDAAGIPRHPAYTLGQSRASCVLCIYLRRSELDTAAWHNPLLAQCYALTEQVIGHRLRADLGIGDVIAALGIPPLPGDTPIDAAVWRHLIARSRRVGILPPLDWWADVVTYHQDGDTP